MNLTLNDAQEFDVLYELVTRLSKGMIRSVGVSDGVYCTYHSPSGTEIKYVLFNRAGNTILSVEVQGDIVEILRKNSNDKAFDVITRWMERIRLNPLIEDSVARFMSYAG